MVNAHWEIYLRNSANRAIDTVRRRPNSGGIERAARMYTLASKGAAINGVNTLEEDRRVSRTIIKYSQIQ